MNHLSKRDYFAGQAMLAVVQETQETVPASFWDLVKANLRDYGFMFLIVKYRTVENVYEDAADKAFLYADAMVKLSNGE